LNGFCQEVKRYMPNIKSAIKRVKTSEKRRLRNASQKSALRTAIKSFEAAAAGANPETARAALIQASRKLDKAASKGLIHKNAAARKKSRLAKKLNEISANA
jgi:small subunit ribosomal protein S20